MRRALLALSMTVSIFAVGGCGGSSNDEQSAQTVTTITTDSTTVPQEPDEKPDEFFERLMGYEYKAQWGRAWDLLHPAQQAFVSREKLQECQSDFPTNVELESFKTVEIYDDPIDLPAIPQKTSKAVTYEFTVRQGSNTETNTRTSHAILVDGRWAWVLAPGDEKYLKAGECPP